MADSVTGRPSRRSSAPGGIGLEMSTQRSAGDATGQFVGPPDDVGGVFGRIGLAQRRDLSNELGRAPRRLPLGDRLDRPSADQWIEIAINRTSVEGLSDRVLDHVTRFHSERSGLLAPAVVEAGGVDRLGLAGSAVDGGFPIDHPPLAWRWFAAHRVDEAVELLVDAATHLSGADRELGEQLVGDVADLGDAVLGCVPDDAEPLRQLGSQTGVVERRQCALVALDEAGVEREPAAVG